MPAGSNCLTNSLLPYKIIGLGPKNQNPILHESGCLRILSINLLPWCMDLDLLYIPFFQASIIPFVDHGK